MAKLPQATIYTQLVLDSDEDGARQYIIDLLRKGEAEKDAMEIAANLIEGRDRGAPTKFGPDHWEEIGPYMDELLNGGKSMRASKKIASEHFKAVFKSGISATHCANCLEYYRKITALENELFWEAYGERTK